MDSLSFTRSNSESVVDEQEVSDANLLNLRVYSQKLLHGVYWGRAYCADLTVNSGKLTLLLPF
jgi:hypothetical protein